MESVWAGIDAGKNHHHVVVIDGGGTRLFSKRFTNEESAILAVMAQVGEIAGDRSVVWATDLNRGVAGLLLAIMAVHSQQVMYLPGRSVYIAAKTYRGDGKSDAKDAGIIADQARMRTDLSMIRVRDQIAADLRILGARRADLVCDKTRAINRLRATLGEFFPALEASFDYSTSKAALVLVTKYHNPAAIRRAGVSRIAAWLKGQGCYRAETIAAQAVTAAKSQYTTVAGQDAAALIVAALAQDILRLREHIDQLDAVITSRFRQHATAALIESIPGFGPLLGAEFIAATGGDLATFTSADRLAGVAGLAPVPRDSGRITGNLHRPKRYDRRLLRACYLAAQTAAVHHRESRIFYLRKRSEGKRHTQAILALARRRINLIWAICRDNSPYQSPITT